MVRLTSPPRSFSLSVAAAVTGSTEITWGAASSALRLAPPRRNGWTSRALRSRAHSHLGHVGLIAAHRSVTAGDHSNSNNLLDSPPVSDDRPHAHAHSIDATREPPSVHALVITCSAVGGVIALAAILAIVYIRRVRRRVKRMKKCTNVLGPELAPTSPSQLSHLSIDSPRAKFDGKRIIPPRVTSEMTSHLPPLNTAGSPMSIECPNIPLSPIRASTIFLSLPPSPAAAAAAAAKRSSNWSSDPNPNFDHPSRSPIRSSHAHAAAAAATVVPWPFITDTTTSQSSSDHRHHHHPQYDREERNTGSDSASESTVAHAY